ncbi:hypothetical protein Dolphis_123 [Pseudomonas phage Dolphis]|nr:hypothetical protein Dolphis_123 [Pseudomonas phage Dolphis]
MSINLRGHVLNQRQLDAITPVMNDLMQGRVSQKKFEQACVDALEKAGCPLGYDTTMPGADKTVEERAVAWIRDGRVGSSSRAIHDHMLGLKPKWGYSEPSDPSDLNRCLLLLDLIPEWKPRMHEMAQRTPQWAGLVARWDEITQCFLDEVGLDWSKGHDLRATKTYALMKQAQGRA